MTFIILILIILLIISIINNYIMYQRKIDTLQCPSKIISAVGLPDNTEYHNITFFYKKNSYNKCHKDDLKNNINSKIQNQNRYQGEMILRSILDIIKKYKSKYLYYVINDDKSSVVNLSDENIIGINYLPNK